MTFSNGIPYKLRPEAFIRHCLKRLNLLPFLMDGIIERLRPALAGNRHFVTDIRGMTVCQSEMFGTVTLIKLDCHAVWPDSGKEGDYVITYIATIRRNRDGRITQNFKIQAEAK